MPFLAKNFLYNHSLHGTSNQKTAIANHPDIELGEISGITPCFNSNLHLLIDTVQITAPVPDFWQEETCSLALDNCKDIESYKSLYAGNKPYKYVYLKMINGSGVYFEICPKPSKKNLPFLRFKFNPSKLGEMGIIELQSELDNLLSPGWKHILQHGRITRLDIALDVAGISLDSITITPNGPLRTTVYKRSGNIETIYLGAPKSANQWRIYDKAVELKSKGIAVACGTLVRFERRIRTNMKVENLHKLKNPFATISVGMLPACPTHINANRRRNLELLTIVHCP
jgi:hypothetical protein